MSAANHALRAIVCLPIASRSRTDDVGIRRPRRLSPSLFSAVLRELVSCMIDCDYCVCQHYYYGLLLLLLFLNLGRSSRGGRQKLILEIIALMVNHPSRSHQQSSRAAG